MGPEKSRWFELKGLPVCTCGQSLCKKGMLREKLGRPVPLRGPVRADKPPGGAHGLLAHPVERAGGGRTERHPGGPEAGGAG